VASSTTEQWARVPRRLFLVVFTAIRVTGVRGCVKGATKSVL